jgi:hypothetical protein
MTAKSDSPSPAQRQVQVGAQKSKFLSVISNTKAGNSIFMRTFAFIIAFTFLFTEGAFAANSNVSGDWTIADSPTITVHWHLTDIVPGFWWGVSDLDERVYAWDLQGNLGFSGITQTSDGTISYSGTDYEDRGGGGFVVTTTTISGKVTGNSIRFALLVTRRYTLDFPTDVRVEDDTISETCVGTITGAVINCISSGTYFTCSEEHWSQGGGGGIPHVYFETESGTFSGFSFPIYVTPIYHPVSFLDESDLSRQVMGATADGASKVVIQITNLTGDVMLNDIQISIPGGTIDGSLESDKKISNGVFTQTYVVPVCFIRTGHSEDITAKKRTVELVIAVKGVQIHHQPFTLVRPPVVLLHGLWAADPPIWTGLKAYLKSNGFNVVNDDPYPDDYSFEQNHSVVHAHVDRALAEARLQGLVAKKADVVGHSMGGILIEKYGDSSYVRRAVAVGTPHFGSPWANYLLARPWLELVLNVYGGKSMRHGAISDLQTGVCNVPGGSLNVPVLAIAGESSSGLFPGSVGAVFSAIFSIATLAGSSPSQVHTALFGTATSDWVVSVPSQAGGLSAEKVPGIWHLEEPGNSDVFSKVTDFLNAPTGGAGTAIAESTQPQIQMGLSAIASPPSPAYGPLTDAEGEITITAPSAGTMYSPGDTVHVSVVVPPGTTKVWVATPGIPPVISQTPPFAIDITIRQEAIGQSSIIAVAWGAEGFLAMTSTVVNVTTPASVASIKVWPDSVLYLSTGEIVPFVVHGIFTDDVERDITRSQCGTAYATTDSSVASIDTNGVLTAKAPGYCLVIVSNGVSQQIPLLVQPAPPPAITTQPQSMTVMPGSNVIFTVMANGTEPLSYQWRKNGTNMVNGGIVSGATNSALTIANVQTNNAGNYTVVVTNSFGSVTSSPPAILIVDGQKPTNQIVLPTAGLRVSNAVYTVMGKAGDNVAVSNLFYQLNNGGWNMATTTNNWTNWTTQVSLLPGTNVVQAYAMDTAGNKSTTNSVSFNYVVTNQLGVRAIGLGTLSPNYSNAWLEIGRNYSITSAPASGFVFTNWVISTNWIGGTTMSKTNLQFMMASNLTLQVNFVDVTKPTLAITAPSAGQHMTNALATVKGTASDNWKVAGVWYQLNSDPWNLVNTTNSYTNWAKTVTLLVGTNTLKAYALDLGGNYSTTNNLSVVSSNTFKLQLTFTNALPLKTNGLVFSLQLSTGLNGRIQVSTNLTSWVTLTNFVGTNSTLIFRDAAATNYNRRFYRAVVP